MMINIISLEVRWEILDPESDHKEQRLYRLQQLRVSANES